MAVRPEVGSVEFAEEDIELFESDIPWYFSDIAETARNLTAFIKGIEAFVNAEAVGRPKKLILEYLDFCVQLGTAHYVSSLGLDVDFAINFRGESYPFVRERSQPRGMRFSNVINGALILRDDTVLQVLREINHNDFEETGKPMRARFLQRLAKPELDQEDLYLLEGLIATESDSQPRSKETRQFYDNISLPCWRVYETILTNNEDAYNTKFAEAISIHDDYWRSQSRLGAIEALISMYLLGVAVVAYDRRGWNVPIETPYVPEWIVTGEVLPIK